MAGTSAGWTAANCGRWTAANYSEIRNGVLYNWAGYGIGGYLFLAVYRQRVRKTGTSAAEKGLE